jgi:hypothetical protein
MGVGENFIGNTRFHVDRHDLAFEALGEAHRFGDAVLGRVVQAFVMRRADIERDPGDALALGHPARRAHQPLADWGFVQADENAILRRPRPGNGVRAHVMHHLRIHALGCDAHRQLAQGGEIALREEVRDGAARLLGHVDLALAQPLDEVVRRQVDQLDLAGQFQDLVGQRLADLDTRDPGDDIVQALDVLDVQRGVDVDAGGEQVLDVLVTLFVAAARDVGMRKFIDEHQLGLALQHAVDVHLAEIAAAIENLLARHDLQPAQQRFRLSPAMRLDDADDDILALGQMRLGGLQHGVGLAHARKRPEKDLQFASALALGFFEEIFGCGALIVLGHDQLSGGRNFLGKRVES